MTSSKKTVLVTGADGFIGAHTAMALKDAGYYVIGLDAISSPYMYRYDFYNTSIICDVGQPNLPEMPELVGVMHIAGTSLVRPSITDPSVYYANNTGATAKLLQWLAYRGFKGKFIFSSSAAVYGEPTTTLITEDHVKNPLSPYGQSKLMAEKVIEDCANAYGMTGVALRYFNACGADPKGRYGQMPNATHLVARIIESVLANDTFVVNGNDYPTYDGTCIRDYLHVSDIAAAHIAVLESASRPYSVYNLGTGKGYTITDIIEAVQEVAGKTVNVEYGPRRAGDPAVLVADSSRFRADFDWQPDNSSIENIISTAWNWYTSDKFKPLAKLYKTKY